MSNNVFRNLFSAGDVQRMEREEQLTQQAPRQLPAEDRSPPEDHTSILAGAQAEPDFDAMLKGLMQALERKLQ